MSDQMPDISQFTSAQPASGTADHMPDVSEFTGSANSTPSQGSVFSTSKIARGALDVYNEMMAPMSAKADAFVKGGEYGMMQFGTTLNKWIATGLRNLGVPEKYAPPNDAIQYNFNQLAKEYQEAKLNMPMMSTMGMMAGTMAATAPIPLASAGDIYKGLSFMPSGLLGNTVRAGASAAGLAAQTGLLGGVTTSPNQDPNQTWNAKNAQSGALVGLGMAGIEGLARGYLSNMDTLEGAKQATTVKVGNKTVQYGGPIFESDLSNSYQQSLANKVWDNSFRQDQRYSQIPATQDFIKNYLNAMDDVTGGKPVATIANAVNGFNTALKNQRNQIFADTYKYLDDNIGPMTLSSDTQAQMRALIADHPELAKSGILPESLSSGMQILPSDLKNVKNDIYDRVVKIQNNKSPSSQDLDLANQLRSLYFNIRNDMTNTMAGVGGNPSAINAAALEKFENANAFEDGYRTMQQQSGNMINAIDNYHTDKEGMNKFISFLLNSKDPSTAQKYSPILGDAGQTALGQLKLKQMYESSISGRNFDMKKFLDQYDKLDNSTSSMLMGDTVDAMRGLVNLVVDPNVQSAMDRAGGGALNTVGNMAIPAASAAAYAGYKTGSPSLATAAGAGVLASGYVLGNIFQRSPIKNFLINYANAKSPGLSQWLGRQVLNQFGRIGVVLTPTQDGGYQIDQQKPEDVVNKMKAK